MNRGVVLTIEEFEQIGFRFGYMEGLKGSAASSGKDIK